MAGLDEMPNLDKFKELNWVTPIGCHLGVNLASTWRQHDAPETETEAETKVELEEKNVQQAAPQPKTIESKKHVNTRKSTSRLSEYLEGAELPPTEWGEWANTEFGWGAERITAEWADFYDYWTSGNAVGGGRKADWPATWRGHCRRNAKNSYRGGGNGNRPNGGLAAAASTVMARPKPQSGGSGSIGGDAQHSQATTDGTGIYADPDRVEVAF